jgi:hypothetical protein
MKMQQLMEARIAQQMAERDRLARAWAPIVEAAEENLKKDGRTLSVLQKRNIARMCENALLNAAAGRRRLFETTDSSNIDFLGIQLPIIAALTPSLVLNEIATVQALEKRTGGLFYLNVTAVNAKGGVTAGQNLIGAKTGHVSSQTARRYASQRVEAELVSESTGLTVTGTLAYLPAIAGSVVVTNGVETFTDDGAGNLVGDTSPGAGTVDYDTGAVSVTFAYATTTDTYASYKYNYETKTTNPIPEINFDIVQATVTAEDFPLRSTYTLTSAVDLEKAWGLSLEDEVVKYVGNEVKFSQDHLGIDLMLAQAKGSDATTLSPYAITPSTGETWIWKKFQVLDHFEAMNNAIIAKTLRMMGTFLVVGNNGARLLKQLDGHFKFAGTPISQVTGPYVLGELDGRVVVHDPFFATNDIMMGYKGPDWKEAAFAYCPYIPLLSTPTVALSTLKVEKGFLSSAAYVPINPGGFCYSTLSGY